jgi:gliding motility-associated-like protein
MVSMKYHLLSLIAFVLVSSGIQSQIAVQTVTPTQAVDLLVGSGVQYSNVTYTGDSLQLGSFTGAIGMDFQIPAGIVLSTQAAEDIELNSSFPFLTNTVSDNADLLDIANSVPPLIGQNFIVGGAYDVCILEFDFIPNGDSLIFEYIFGSDEYLTYVNSQFNDVFAFFIAGPGITGPYSAPAGFPDGSSNIAFIPNTDPEIPITISSVNNVLNSEYYINNPSVQDIALNGYTITMQAYAPVICGQTYHIRLAIADGSDTALKSVVAFQEGSFSSNGAVDVTITNPPIPNWPNNTLVEDCVFGGFQIFQSDISTADTLNVTYGGTAINGIDFDLLPSQVIVPEGQASTTVLINPILDNLVEGDETITITFTFTNGCDQLDTAYAEVILLDETPVTLQLNNTFCVCPGDPNEVSVNVLTGIQPYQYAWSNSTDQSALQLNPGEGGTYSVVVTDFCNNTSSAEVLAIDCNEYQIAIETADAPLGFPANTVMEGCVNGTFVVSENNLDEANAFNIVISGTATNGTDYTSLTNSYTIPVGQASVSIPIVPLTDDLAEGNETITITINYVNACGNNVVASSTMTIAQYTAMTVSIDDETICENATITANGQPTGGVAPYDYTWNGGSSLSTLSIGDYGDYSVTVTDFCDGSVTESFVISAPPVLTSTLDESVFICPNTNENVNVTPAGGQAPYLYLWSNGSTTSATNVDTEDAGTVTVVVTDFCGVTVQDQIVVEIPTPLIAAPPVELCLGLSAGNVFVGGTEPYVLIYDQDSVSVSSTYTVTVIEPGVHDVFVQDACGETAVFTVYGVACNTIIPNIVTPNGDSLNDVFKISSIDRFPNSTVMIFNRWGNMVYESTNYSNATAWDASGLADGVYFYIFQRSDGEKFEGNVQVVR